jgi:colanic acid biosynthesis protein WcaH
MAAPDTLIPAEQYKQILELMPVVCVDILVRRGGQHLLVRRADEPLKGEWWVPGGRILKGETALEAAYRKLKQETGIKPEWFEFVGFYEDFYENSAFSVPCHTVSIVYQADVTEHQVTLDQHSSEYKWDWSLPMRMRLKLKP